VSIAHASRALDYHQLEPHGKLALHATKPCETAADLALAYTPGVAEPCLQIARNPSSVYDFTAKGNLVAVVTNGTAVLGLGDIGPAASKPVMEGKAVLFKRFGNVDAIDIELDARTPDEIVAAVRAIAPTFGGINLEDIKAPECFEVERRLQEALDIPVFHDDQHGTAIVLGAALLNALALTGQSPADLHIAVNGAGAAATAIVLHLRRLGVPRDQIVVCDRKGVIFSGRIHDAAKEELAVPTGARSLADAIRGANVFIGVSVGGALTPSMLASMAPNPIVFALANPTPEIDYHEALTIRPDAIVATGRSDFPNQVNNVLAFPFIFRAALDVRAREINGEMKEAASEAIAELARGETFGPESLVPSPFDPRLLSHVAPRIAKAARASGVARR
jgi:malate dehydrogenase (oxaloacetate-decarboxylating)(NADP+)